MDRDKLINQWSEICASASIESSLYQQYNVQRGLRDVNGKGVLAGLTKISEVNSTKLDENGVKVPCEGELKYRGININEIVRGVEDENRFGFEEATYLLLFGKLPTALELDEFSELLSDYRFLPNDFLSDIIIRTPSRDMMNTLMRGVLSLYTYDQTADNISISNVLRQGLDLIAKIPLIAVYGYQSYTHHFCGNSLFIHTPQKNLSTAENLLRLLRADGKYTALEAHVLDIALILHAEHGGGNNSTFTDHVVSSSGTDTYSAISASLGSLKGPRHGGANVKVAQMFDDLKANVSNIASEQEVEKYLVSLLDKKSFDHSGLIYGMGHAVYSLSDPRADILSKYAKMLSEEQGLQEEYALYDMVARMAPEIISERRKIYKGVSPNVDFYSGLVYKMLGIPYELFTPIFATARIVGWTAHRIEELINDSKIIRPAYEAVQPGQEYVSINHRTR
ncbi:MAG: citrate/2-methylcitrate synthase [Clostridia bacterium]